MFRVSCCAFPGAKGSLLLCLHNLLVIRADFEDLLLYVLFEEIYSALHGHHIITPPLPPRLSANEVRKRLLAFASFLPHGRRYCIYPRRPACLLHCLLHTPPHKSPKHRIIIHQYHPRRPLYTLAALHHHRHLVRANQRRTCV